MKNGHKTRFLPKVANPIRLRTKSTAKTVVPSVIREGIIAEIADPPPGFLARNPPSDLPQRLPDQSVKTGFFLSWEVIPLRA